MPGFYLQPLKFLKPILQSPIVSQLMLCGFVTDTIVHSVQKSKKACYIVLLLKMTENNRMGGWMDMDESVGGVGLG
jgi:hypothetical protein